MAVLFGKVFVHHSAAIFFYVSLHLQNDSSAIHDVNLSEFLVSELTNSYKSIEASIKNLFCINFVESNSIEEEVFRISIQKRNSENGLSNF